jgi:hypothetical protein
VQATDDHKNKAIGRCPSPSNVTTAKKREKKKEKKKKSKQDYLT